MSRRRKVVRARPRRAHDPAPGAHDEPGRVYHIEPVGFMGFYILLYIAAAALFASQASLYGVTDLRAVGTGLLLLVLVVRAARVRVVVYRDRVEFRNLFRSGTVLRGTRVEKRRNVMGAAGARGWKFQTPSGRYIASDALLRFLGSADVQGAVAKALSINFGTVWRRRVSGGRGRGHRGVRPWARRRAT